MLLSGGCTQESLTTGFIDLPVSLKKRAWPAFLSCLTVEVQESQAMFEVDSIPLGLPGLMFVIML